ncbi:MAG: ATP synthase subunit I [Acidobacteria bacterium]|jgi:hypothetical protein|nr:MAG: ATP synthase subunit I [Acidobacteriota bacterium]GIU82860.1 MAG: hypothetical protein KatS3mg006_1924 [Pyrinomonadaceae bacterium]
MRLDFFVFAYKIIRLSCKKIIIQMNSNGETVDANSNRQVLQKALCLLGISILASLLLAEFKFALGLLIGGILTLANYFWLKRSLAKMFESIASTGQKPLFPAASYALRYFALGSAIYLVYKTDIASVTAVLFGLCSIAAAVFLEGIFLTFRTFVEEVK